MAVPVSCCDRGLPSCNGVRELPFSIQDRINEAAFRKKIPIYAMLEITQRCNLRCKHCVITDRRSSELTTAEIQHLIDDLADAQCLLIYLSGGEPLIRSDFFEIARSIKRRRSSLTIFTNGNLIDEETSVRIGKLSPAYVGISIYGARPQTHDWVTGVTGSFERSIKAVRLLRRHGVTVQFKCLLMRHNAVEYQKIIELASGLGALCGFTIKITPRRNRDMSPLPLTIGEDALRKIIRFDGGRMLRPYITGIKPDLSTTPLCGAGHMMCCISASGDVYPCTSMPLILGNVRDESFHQIWKHSQVVTWLRSKKLRDIQECPTCSKVAFCMRCPGLAYLHDGKMLKPVDRLCKISQIVQEEAIEQSIGE